MAIETPNILVAALALEAVAGQNDQINIVSANGIDIDSFVRTGPGAYTLSLREAIAVESLVFGGRSDGVAQSGIDMVCTLKRAPNALPPYANLTDYVINCIDPATGGLLDSTCAFTWWNVRTEFAAINVT